jgi:hypothetical protein
MESNQPVITQGTLPLPAFGADVPLLHTAEGEYVPIRALCDALGLPPATYIGSICRHSRYGDAVRAWPWKNADGISRPMWRLQRHYVHVWLSNLRPSQLHGERREQLRAYHEALAEAAGLVYERRQEDRQALRRAVYAGLAACQRMQVSLAEIEEQVCPHLAHLPAPAGGEVAVGEFRVLLARGREAYDAYAMSLREVLAEITGQSVIDALVLDERGEVIDAQPMPILPVVPDLSVMRRRQERALAWSHELQAWLAAHGFRF